MLKQQAYDSVRTLLFGLSETTISECTFRDLSRSLRRSFAARNTAARACVLETICVHQVNGFRLRSCYGLAEVQVWLTTLASIKAYSNSDLPAISCCRRYEEFRTSRKRATWIAREGGRCERWNVFSIWLTVLKPPHTAWGYSCLRSKYLRLLRPR